MKSFNRDVAILGYACRLPGAGDAADFWRLLDEARCAVTAIPPDRFPAERHYHPNRLVSGKSVSFAAGIVENAFDFDPGFFGISPREAIQMDPQQRMLAQVVWEALENAGIRPSSLKGSSTGVYVGASSLDHMQIFASDPGSTDAQLLTGNTLSIIANRISFLLDLRGPSLTVDTACSSSLMALHQACCAIDSGSIDLAIVGGVNFLTAPYPFCGFSRAFMLSEKGLCRAFDAGGDGYVRAEGAVAIVIQRASSARTAGRRARARIVGWGANCDGWTPGLSMPSSESQTALLRQIYETFALAPADLAFIEAHGTGTRVGDPVEARALGAALGQKRQVPLPIGSVKTNIGHLEPASGLAGLLKAMLALENNRLPPSLHFETPNPDIAFDELNVTVASQPLPLAQSASRPRLAGVNSFGFGGANAHIVLADGDAWREPAPRPAGPILLSAASRTALQNVARNYLEHLPAETNRFAAFASATFWRRDQLQHRAWVMPNDHDGAEAALRALADGFASPETVVGQATGAPGNTIFAFAGNGSQWAGMGLAAFASNPAFRHSLEETDRLFQIIAGRSILGLLQAPDLADRLPQAIVSQPLLFALQVATADALREFGVTPAAVLGHSAGEVAAACVCGALTREDALRIIDLRSAIQEPLRGKGTMAALVLSEAEAEKALLDPSFDGVEIAATNTARSLTLSGPVDALATFLRHARRQRWPYVRLDIEYPFHSRQLDAYRDEVIEALAAIKPRPSAIAFFSTVTGERLDGERLDGEYWWRNMRERVRFAQATRNALALQPRLLLEIGPSPVLTSYLGDVAREAGSSATALASLERNDDERRDAILKTAARVFVNGGVLDMEKIAGACVAEDIDLPNYPWQNERYKIELSAEATTTFLPDAHPLLGAPPFRDSLTFYRHVDQETIPWLADHKVQGSTVVPAAALMELLLACAAQALGEGAIELSDCAIIRPLALAPGITRNVITQAFAQDDIIGIESRTRGSSDEATLHVRSKYAASAIKQIPPPESRDQCVRAASAEEIYALTSAYQLHYGPAFRRLKSVVQRDATICDFEISPAPEGWPEFLLDPGALDAAFHAGLWMLHGDKPAPTGEYTYLPTFVERLRLFKPGARISSGRMSLTPKLGGGVMDYLTLMDEQGDVVASLTGGRFMRAQLDVQTNPVARYETSLVPLPPRSGHAALPVEIDVRLCAPSSTRDEAGVSPAGRALDQAARAAAAQRYGTYDPCDAQLPQHLRALLAQWPQLIAEAMACSALARGRPLLALERALAGSPRARVLAEIAINLVKRLVEAPELNRPLRVLVCEPGDEMIVARLGDLLQPKTGTFAVADRDSSRLARLSAMLGLQPSVKFLEWSELGLAAEQFDVALFCDALTNDAPTQNDLRAISNSLAPRGAFAFIRYDECDFARLLKPLSNDASSTPAASLEQTLAAAGFSDADSHRHPSAYGEILLTLARKHPAAEGNKSLASPAARKAKLSLFHSSEPDALVGALAALGIDIIADDDASQWPQDVIILAHQTGADDAMTPLASMLAELADLLKRSAASKRRFHVIVSHASQDNPDAAAIAGFVRVAANEYPDCEFRLIDVCADLQAPATVQALAMEIAAPRREREIVLARDGAYALRAIERAIEQTGPIASPAYRLEIAGQGSLDRLRWTKCARRTPGPGEVEIEVEASGLNFRDVMWALGQLPPEALENGFAGASLGMECAGRVTAVGAGVDNFAPGDDVVAFAPGSLASHVTVAAFAVARRPAGIDAEAATTLPVAFLTSWYGLTHLARVESGESVLVHGGAGGVGLAAIQILRNIGARIFATAGTPEKRQLLLDLGVDHVFDSRNLLFADQIMDITGGQGVDAVLNSLAGEAMERSIECLKPFGRFIELGKRDFFANTRIGLRPFRQNLSYFGVDADQLLIGQQKLAQRLFADVMRHFESGALRPLPWRAFDAPETTAAFRLMQQSAHVGKIVIRPQRPTIPTATAQALARADATYLIVGGLGGFGLALARRLAARGAGRLVLVGRRGLVGADAEAQLAAIRSMGCETIVRAADASSPEKMIAIIDAIGADKPLRGVFHVAMTIDDATIANLSQERIAPVLQSKITVAKNLDALTANHALDWFVLFSSASALVGNPGQASYVAANAWLEGLARRRRARGQVAHAIGWGAISDVGYLTRQGEAAQSRLQRLSRHAMTSGEALDGLEALLAETTSAQSQPIAVVARFDWTALSRDLPLLATPLFDGLRRQSLARVDTSGLREELVNLDDEKARGRILAELVREIGKIMRIPPKDVDVTRSLAELGVDSLMGVELRLAAEEKFGVEIPLLSIGTAGSLNDLAQLVLRQMRASGQENVRAN